MRHGIILRFHWASSKITADGGMLLACRGLVRLPAWISGRVLLGAGPGRGLALVFQSDVVQTFEVLEHVLGFKTALHLAARGRAQLPAPLRISEQCNDGLS